MMRCLTVVACTIALTLVGASAGCQSGAKATTGQTVSALAGEWTLKSIGGSDAAKMLPEGSRLPNIAIAGDGKVTGFGGVNRLSSALDVQGVPAGAFKLGPMISTKMAGPPEAMDMENRFTRALGAATSFELKGDELHVRGADASGSLTLVRGGTR